MKRAKRTWTCPYCHGTMSLMGKPGHLRMKAECRSAHADAEWIAQGVPQAELGAELAATQAPKPKPTPAKEKQNGTRADPAGRPTGSDWDPFG